MVIHLHGIRGHQIGVQIDFGVTFDIISRLDTHQAYCFQCLSMKSSMFIFEIS